MRANLKKNGTGPNEFIKRMRETAVKIPPRISAELSSTALLANYHAIQEMVPNQSILPMVKANAYGHGAEWVGGLLGGLSNLYGFGVATLDEGAQLRSSLGARNRKTPIIVFSETTPWSQEKGQFCEQNHLRAVIASEADWSAFVKQGWTSRISYEIQVNTGMNRLGVSPAFVQSLIRDLRLKPAEEHPAGVFSHLAMGESPDSKLSLSQVDKFASIRRELSSVLPSTHFHLANSGGIWNSKYFGLRDLTDVVRPGLALYGVPPWSGAPARGISAVMKVQVSVIGVHRLKPGDSIGYGGTFKVSGTQPVFAAILGAGYADGIHRALSNTGFAWLDGRSTRMIGTVSMDLCAIKCSPDTQVGEWAELIGPHVDPWAQARAASTIPYELLTSLSTRVKRVYDSNF